MSVLPRPTTAYLPAEDVLLSRKDFRELALRRDDGRCVLCGAPATEVHHLLERRLFPEGGYRLGNAASVCGECHRRCERTEISVEELRAASGIVIKVLPEEFYPEEIYTKWGDPVLPNGQRMRGPLFQDPSVQRILREGGMLDRYTERVKYPRTFHVPWSPGEDDDRVLPDLAPFVGRRVIVTRKLDGENSTLYSDGFLHARSLDSAPHPTQSRARATAAILGPQLPLGWRLVCENLQGTHTIHYRHLPGYLVLLSIWNERNECLSWEETVEWAALLELPTAPVLYDGPFDEALLRGLHTPLDEQGDEAEGWVMRLAEAFAYRDFSRSAAKWVRPGHVPEQARSWRRGPITENEVTG